MEIETISDFVDAYLRDNPETPPGRVLILATRRFLGLCIKSALISRGRNALSFFYEDEVEEKQAAEGLCLLNLLVTPNDRAALRGWLGLHRPNDGAAAPYRRIREHAEQCEMEVRDVLEQLADGTMTLPYCGPVIDRYRELRTRVAALDGLTGNGLVDALWPSTVPEVADIRVLAGNLAVENPSPSALLDTLRRDIMQPELPGSEGDVIRIMSLHKSKGLTADVCIVTGCVAGALPTITEEEPAGQDAERYEQRRLFYVAVTRPQRVLVISSSRLIESGLARRSLIDTFGMENGRARMQPSTFIDELGPSCPAAIRSDEWRDAAAFPRRA
jgi:DNA helicase II / ATP-dependent DNA helicase PcrA